ncbi:MAG TPA: 2-dehydropantoate 2-reductase N-terminal domain-containing protein [Burkholderiales bacterium]|jgi:2-dehydropantoate 2-reductase|nr:2-dehydropantoate 2-reductase N-terminal domain-containing protein [Burkholderiales bacterium]
MQRKIAVLGAGAIGSSIGADLTQGGHDVTIVDQWPAQIEALQSSGVRVCMTDQEVHVPVRALHLCDLSSANIAFDIVFLAVKSNDHRWLAEFIKPYLKSEGVLVATQNGMNDDSIASIVGRNRTVGCVLELSAEIFTPGLVKRNTTRTTTWFALGELDGFYTPRVKEIESILSKVGRVEVTNNIYGAKWTKLIANTMTMGPFGLLGLGNRDAAALPGMFDMSVKLGKESLAVGAALGYRMEPIFGLRADEFAGSGEENLVTAMKTLLGHVSNGRTAPIHDHIKGRKSEMEFISGVVSRKGKELGIPTPYNDAVMEIDRQINTRAIKMDASNFELLKQRAAAR